MEPIIISENNKVQTLNGGKPVTGEKVLLMGSFKPAYKVHSGEKRWFDNDEIVRFTDVQFWTQNAEFTINGDGRHKMWFSQLDDLFLNPFPTSIEDFVVSTWVWSKFHDDPWAFWEYVKEKTFKVSILNAYCCIINFEASNCRQTTYDEAMNYYLNNYLKGNYQDIFGMLKLTRCYILDEV